MYNMYSVTTVLRRGKLKIAIYRESGNRHHSPHCHVYLADAEAIFDLNEFNCIANNGFRRKALDQIAGIVKEHQEEFLDVWRMLNEEE
jgi:hypothetical protein